MLELGGGSIFSPASRSPTVNKISDLASIETPSLTSPPNRCWSESGHVEAVAAAVAVAVVVVGVVWVMSVRPTDRCCGRGGEIGEGD